MKSTWSVDNFYIGKMPASPSMMSDDFDSQTMSDSWLFINEGKVKNYCEHNIRWGVVPGYTKSRMFCFLCCWDKPFASAQQRAFKSCFWTTHHYSNPISYNTPSHYITLQSTQYFTKRNFRHRSIAITQKWWQRVGKLCDNAIFDYTLIIFLDTMIYQSLKFLSYFVFYSQIHVHLLYS